jgi:hypothetical protein
MEEGGCYTTEENITINQTRKDTEQIFRLLQLMFLKSPNINPLR